jgi:hypothetical protein
MIDYFTKWLRAYTIPKKKALMVAEALVTNFLCRFRVMEELHTDQGCSSKFHLMQVFQ